MYIHVYTHIHSPPQLEGDTSVPFIKGQANFTRLRVDRPATHLTLVFRTDPKGYETSTSVQFTVVAPPTSTPREKVEFVLEGDLESLNLPGVGEDWGTEELAKIVEAIRLGLSNSLGIDISRIKNVIVTVSVIIDARVPSLI